MAEKVKSSRWKWRLVLTLRTVPRSLTGLLGIVTRSALANTALMRMANWRRLRQYTGSVLRLKSNRTQSMIKDRGSNRTGRVGRNHGWVPSNGIGEISMTLG